MVWRLSRRRDGELSGLPRADRAWTVAVAAVLLVTSSGGAGPLQLELGSNDFRISDMGPDGDGDFDARDPAVAYNTTDDVYLVVWSGNDGGGMMADQEREIFGQLLLANGTELGGNDFRISEMGPDGSVLYAASNPALAYNSTDNQFLVVWGGDHDAGTLADEENEIFGERLLGPTGDPAGTLVQVSDMGGVSGDPDFDAGLPAVTHNAVDNEYLVVWRGDDSIAPLVDDEFEIFGQRMVGSTGFQIGFNDFRISSMGSNGNTTFEATNPDVVHNPLTDEYLVVWQGNDGTGTLGTFEFEIFGQRLAGDTAAEVGLDDFRLSDIGREGLALETGHPAVTFNPDVGEYLVIWRADEDLLPLTFEDFEIFGQRVSLFGEEVGANDFRISDMGPDGSEMFAAGFGSDVAYDSPEGGYLVVWWGDDDTGTLVDDEFEVFGQRLSPTFLDVFIGGLSEPRQWPRPGPAGLPR